MPSFDREGALKSAEIALRQGRIDAAIAEYVRIVEAQPRDWNSANALGDLYVRAGQIDKGIGHYVRIADHLETEGFYPKAGALYKKILKIKPGDESALLQLGEIASRQGLLADAKQYFNQLVERRKARGDQRGAAELSIRVGTLDPDDLESRLFAARAASEMGDLTTALHELREVAVRLEATGRTDEYIDVLVDVAALDPSDTGTAAKLAVTFVGRGDIARARPFLTPETAGQDAGLWLALAECALTENRHADGRAAVARAVGIDPSRREAAVVLGCRLAETSSEAGYQVIDAVADAAVRAEDYAAAAAALHEFVTRVRFHLVALMRLVEICVDGQLEATMFEAQAQLADAYLEVGRALEARIISEDLVAREPWNRANIERFRKSLVMLGEADPDAIIADRLSGDSPFLAADFIDLNEGVELDAPVPEPPAPKASESRRRGKADAGRTASPAANAPGAEAAGRAFAEMREDTDRPSSDEAATEQYRLALTYQEMGMVEDAIVALESAARSPRQRFDAASMLGRLHLEREQPAQAIEWFERAAEAPAPTPDASRALLYDLASTLEANGETSRALAIFAEMESESGGYRDVASRIDQLSKTRARG
ncbi:MAG TPA: tetratricopeptide repeat protein [Vicinamibacterales bacterium]|nr:tetratricopeptide repeat protein [Vicinamibacterales bacterium]